MPLEDKSSGLIDEKIPSIIERGGCCSEGVSGYCPAHAVGWAGLGTILKYFALLILNRGLLYIIGRPTRSDNRARLLLIVSLMCILLSLIV